jgi:hypothetical protein
MTKQQIKQIKSITAYTSVSFHKNRKNVGHLTVEMIKEIVAKKRARLKNKTT